MRLTRRGLRAQDDTDGALYHEEWARVPESVGECWAFRLAAAAREGVLLCAGDCFMFVAAASTPGAELEARLSYEASYGRVRRGASDAEPCWRITHSTVPGRAGATLLPAHVGPSAEDVEAEAARCGGALPELGACPPGAGWTCSRAWPGAELPEIDLAALDWRADAALRAAEVAKLRGALLTESGSGAFSVKTSAFVAPELVRRAYAHNRAFHELPEAEKQPLHFLRHADGRGWVPLHAEGAYEAGAVASHVTTFDMGRHLAPDHPLVAAAVRGAAPNVYPSDALVPGFEDDMQGLDRGLAQCAAILFRGFAAALGLADECAFAAHFTPETSLGKLRLMCYPGAASSPALLAARNFGVSAHTDFEAHTFLHQDAPGLQLESRSGMWTESPVPDESHFTVIMSDMMEIFSNGALRATRHRVLHVPWRRHALIRFVGFESLAQVAPLPELGPPRYQPVLQGEHLDRQVEEAEARRAASAAAGLIPAPAAPVAVA